MYILTCVHSSTVILQGCMEVLELVGTLVCVCLYCSFLTLATDSCNAAQVNTQFCACTCVWCMYDCMYIQYVCSELLYYTVDREQ